MESEPPLQDICKKFSMEKDGDKENCICEKLSFTADQECELPLIDLSRLCGSELDIKECRRQISDAAKEWGFFQIVNHGISRHVMTTIMQSEKIKLFQQPFDRKANENVFNLSTGCYRWGNPNAISLKDFSWSEAFHIPVANIPALTDFNNSNLLVFTEEVSKLAQRIAEILAEEMSCKSTFFVENCLPNSSYLRINRYPPCPSNFKPYGLVPHTDSDFLTILYQDQSGLQLIKDGEWINVKPIPDALIINIGDLYQAWSNGVYKSIEHRVVTNPETERLSIAYFLCPSPEMVIESCRDEPSIYRKFSYGEYRQQIKEDVQSTGSKIGLLRYLIQTKLLLKKY